MLRGLAKMLKAYRPSDFNRRSALRQFRCQTSSEQLPRIPAIGRPNPQYQTSPAGAGSARRWQDLAVEQFDPLSLNHEASAAAFAAADSPTLSEMISHDCPLPPFRSAMVGWPKNQSTPGCAKLLSDRRADTAEKMLAMSAVAQTRPGAWRSGMSALIADGDIRWHGGHVSFVPEAAVDQTG